MRPYYIFTPHYNTSAGIKVLHRLCHELNSKGLSAFLVLTHFSYRKPLVKKGNITPILTPKILKQHIKAGLTPIGVYHELIEGNKYGLPFVARYMLNFETREKMATYCNYEEVFAYSTILMKYMPKPNLKNILFIPVANAEVFYPPKEGAKREGSCFYASKFKKRGGILNEKVNNKTSTEITRYGNNAPSQAEVANLFRKAEVFYSYEDTTLAIEANMCGCPVVFIPNTIFPSLHLAQEELGIEGYALNDTKEEIERAKRTISKSANNVKMLEDKFYLQLENFIKVTQNIKNPVQPNYTKLKALVCKVQLKFALKKVIKFLRNLPIR